MALGANQGTITTGANFIPELWGPPVIVATENNLVMSKLVWDWSDPVKGKGDTIHVPGISNLTTNTKSANTQVVLNAPTEGVTDLTIGTHQECSFLIEDILKVQSAFNLMQYYTEKTGYALGASRDTALNALVSGFSQVLGSAGADLGDGDIRNGRELLRLANVPMTDPINLVIHPTQETALFAIEKYFRSDFRGDGASQILVNGKIGKIYDIDVYVSTNVGTSAGAYLNTMFSKQAIAKADQLTPRTQGDYILEYLGNLVVSDQIYGQVESRDAFGVWLRS